MKFLKQENHLIPYNEDTKRQFDKLSGIIELELIKDTRSLQQNKYLWKVFQIIGDELGYTKDEIKALLLTELKYYDEITNKKTGEVVKVLRPTHNLNKKDFSELTENIIRFAGEIKIHIMSIEEYFET